MNDSYSRIETALMELDRAVTGLARQAENINKTSAVPMRSVKTPANQTDLFAALGTLTDGATGGLDAIERRLDATITQIEDLLNDDYAVA